MASVRTHYACPACGGRFAVAVLDLDEPAELVSDRDRNLLRSIQRTQEALGGEAGVDPAEEIEAKLLDGFAKDALRHATCPGCQARNPEGVAEVMRRERVLRFGSVALAVVLTVVTYFAPVVAVGLGALLAFAGGLRALRVARAREKVGPLRILAPLALATALIGVWFAAPEYVYPLPLVLGVEPLVAPTKLVDFEFARAAARLRFVATAFRD